MQFKAGFTTDIREFVGTWELVLDEPSPPTLEAGPASPWVRRLRWRAEGTSCTEGLALVPDPLHHHPGQLVGSW